MSAGDNNHTELDQGSDDDGIISMTLEDGQVLSLDMEKVDIGLYIKNLQPLIEKAVKSM